MIYTPEQREMMIADIKNKIVANMEYIGDDGPPSYWVITFTDGSEICFKFMAEFQ